MRIIYLYQYFTTPKMNGGTFGYEMASRLVRAGHEVHMVTTDRSGEGEGWYETDEAGIRVHWCRVPYSNYMSYPRRIKAFFQFAYSAARRAMTLDGDLLYASSPPLTMALPAVYASRKKRIPMIFEVADRWPDVAIAVGALKNPLSIAAAQWLERFAYRHAAHVIAMSPDMKAGVASTGYPAERISVIPNGCDIHRFQVPASEGEQFRREHAWLGDRPLVVYTGAFGLVNGISYLARVAAEAAKIDPEVRFLAVGAGREEELVRRTATALGVLDRNFFLLPPMPKTEIPRVLSAADLATSTVIDRKPLWANSANKVFDGMAAGRGIVINHGGWMADMIHETGCGLVLPPDNYARAAAELVGLLRDRPRLARVQAAAFRVGRERFDREKLVAEMLDVMESLAGTSPRRALAA